MDLNLFRLIVSCCFLSISIGYTQAQPFIKGADVSFLTQIEIHGGTFKDSGITKDPLVIFKDHGFNYIRLRIWHSPPDNDNDLSKTLVLAARLKGQGFRLLLDFHYSDTWADPGHQTIPATWSALPFSTLKESLYQYTRTVITALKNQHTLPDIVQIGNEISCGMLWNEGNICGSYNTPTQWNKLGELLKAGIRGVKEVIDPSDSIRIMIHTDKGTDNAACQWFFNHILEEEVPFDMIGLSYYPWWHGTLQQASSNLNDLATRYNKDIIVVETAYPWTLQWYDQANNIVGDSSQVQADYPATVTGQRAFLSNLISIIKQTPDNKGIGVFYWEPDWIIAPSFGSTWENLTLFDFQGNVLSSIQAFETTPVQRHVQHGWNILSLPATSFELRKTALYPSSISLAFAFTPGGYTQQDTLFPGIGYWLKFPTNQSITFKGDSCTSLTIKVNGGWNLIGSISSPVTVERIIQTPANNILSNFFGYNRGYSTADTLQPGIGYWVNVRQAGELILQE